MASIQRHSLPQSPITNLALAPAVASPLKEEVTAPPVKPPHPLNRVYHILADPNPRPYIFQLKPFSYFSEMDQRASMNQIRNQAFLTRLANPEDPLLSRIRTSLRFSDILTCGFETDVRHIQYRGHEWLHDLRGLQTRPLHFEPLDEAALAKIPISDLYTYFETNLEQLFHDAQLQKHRLESLPLLQNLVRVLDDHDYHIDKDVLRSTRILIQILNRPNFNNRELKRQIFQALIHLEIRDREENRIPALADFVREASGPQFPGWGPYETMLYHMILCWCATEKELLLKQYFDIEHDLDVTQIEHARRVIGDEWGLYPNKNFDSERATIAEWQGASESQNSEEKPALPKTKSSSSLGIHLPEQDPVNDRAQAEEYIRLLNDIYLPKHLIDKITQKMQFLFCFWGSKLNNTVVYDEALSNLCERLMGVDAAKDFMEIVGNHIYPDSFYNYDGPPPHPHYQNARCVPFLLEHMGFLKYLNQEPPQRAPLPPIEVPEIYRNDIARRSLKGAFAELDRNYLEEEQRSLRRRLAPLQACIQDPRWIRVKQTLERALELTRLKLHLVEEKL